MYKIGLLTSASPEALHDINALLPQLFAKPSPIKCTLAELKSLFASKHTTIVVAREGKHIVGMATLFILQKAGRNIAYVEDVVVDRGHRGEGLGEKIMKKVIAIARKKKAKTLALTSNSARVAANTLYQKLGFTPKETNVYRLRF